ncbi:MAG: hypothetical protein ACFFC7_09370 [Candidatus Hermodarchaeota archaeon]
MNKLGSMKPDAIPKTPIPVAIPATLFRMESSRNLSGKIDW